MKIQSIIAFTLIVVSTSCVSESSKPWVDKADSMVGETLVTERSMVIVESYGRMLLVPRNGNDRFINPSENQRVITEIPIGSTVSVKKRTFRIGKPGRTDYLLLDLSGPDIEYSDVFLIVGSTFLADGNFSST